MIAVNDSTYIVGIDLGTTHCVLAYTERKPSEGADREVFRFPIDQVVSPGEVKALPLLPSFLLLPGPHDVPEGGLALPWNTGDRSGRRRIRPRARPELPARLVASAKSWSDPCRCRPHRSPSCPGTRRRTDARSRRSRPWPNFCATSARRGTAPMAANDPALRLEHQEIFSPCRPRSTRWRAS